MFKLIRRISHGVIPRPDRPWEEDPTSNAPHKNRKRHLSISERDDADGEQLGKKRVRGDSVMKNTPLLTPPLPADTKEVRKVTQGVEKVDLAEKKEQSRVLPGDSDDAAPESIHLPDDEAGELGEPAEDDAEGSSTPLEESEGDDASTYSIPEAEDYTPNAPSNEVAEDAKETNRCRICVRDNTPCRVNVRAIIRWREQVEAGRVSVRAPPGTSCERCTVRKKICDFPGTADLREKMAERKAELAEGKKAKVKVRNEVADTKKGGEGGGTEASGSKWKATAVESPPLKKVRVKVEEPETRLELELTDRQFQEQMLAVAARVVAGVEAIHLDFQLRNVLLQRTVGRTL